MAYKPRPELVPAGRRAEDFGRNVRRLRLLRGFSRWDLAVRSNYSERTIGLWESNHRTPYPDSVRHIARCLGVTPEELWRQADE